MVGCWGTHQLALSRSIPTAKQCCKRDKTMDTSPDSPSTPMSDTSTGARGAASSMSLPEDFHAKTSPSPARGEVSTVTAPVSGGRCTASFAKFDPATCSWKTSQRFLGEDSTAFSGRWPNSGSMRNGSCYRQPMLERPIYAGDGGASLPTPTVQDAHNNAAPSQTKRNAMPLNVAVLHIPTPTAGDARSSGTRNNPDSHANLGTSLTDFVKQDGGTGRDKLTPETPKLNPDWVELLMGWPRGWTKVETYKPRRGTKAGKPTALES